MRWVAAWPSSCWLQHHSATLGVARSWARRSAMPATTTTRCSSCVCVPATWRTEGVAWPAEWVGWAVLLLAAQSATAATTHDVQIDGRGDLCVAQAVQCDAHL